MDLKALKVLYFKRWMLNSTIIDVACYLIAQTTQLNNDEDVF